MFSYRVDRWWEKKKKTQKNFLLCDRQRSRATTGIVLPTPRQRGADQKAGRGLCSWLDPQQTEHLHTGKSKGMPRTQKQTSGG